MDNRAKFLAMIGQPEGGKGRANKYDPAFCDTIKIMAQVGEFPEAWAAEIGVSVETLRRWGHEYPDFREALIAAKHLVAAFWQRDIAANRKNGKANAAMYGLIARRLPALFGKEPIDLTEYVLRPDAPEDQASPEALTADAAKAAPTDELQARLEALRKRRMEEG